MSDIRDPRICSVECSHIADLIRIGEETNLSAWSAQSYVDEIRNPASIMLRLVSSENTTVGFIVGRIVDGGHVATCKDAEIYNIAVNAPDQCKGHGQSLLDAFLDKCSTNNVENVWLEVRESNHRAIGFYQKNRFVHVQTRPNFYHSPRENALLMRLNLKEERP
jgi:ribosomal-protein-alanine N-acetyltransferase